MGKAQVTQSVLQQLDEARFKTLVESANNLLSTGIELPEELPLALLIKILKTVVVEQFKSKYSYDFQGGLTKPPNVADDAELNIGSAENICSIRDVGEIPSYVDSVLLSSAEPVWARKPASADIVNQANAIFNTTPQDSWRAAFIDKLYHSTKPDDNSFKVHAVLIHCTILVDDKKYAIIYYAGVYFQVLSPRRAAENTLLAHLISAANALLVTPIPITSPQSIQVLKSILRSHGEKIFRDQFGFPFKDDKTSPNDKLPGASLHAADAICFIKNEEPGVVDSFINNILSVLSLPPWAKDDQSKALLAEAKGLLKINTGNGWSRAFFVRSFDNPTPANNSYKTTAVFIYTNASITEANFTVKMSFIYYLGVYYGAAGPRAVAENALLANLCRTAAALLPEPIPIQSPPTVQDLDKILKAHGLLQFRKDFGIPYKGDQTVPNDIARDTQAQGISVLLHVENRNGAALNEAVQFNILQNVALPIWAQDHIRSQLQRYTTFFLKGPAGFGWKNFKFTDPIVGKDNSFKTIASLTYSNATHREGSIELNYSFVYFVGVFYYTLPLRVGAEPSAIEVVS